MPSWTTTWEGSHRPPGSPPGVPLYVPQAPVSRADPLKSSEKTLFQPGRSPRGMATPDGPTAGLVGGGGEVFRGGVGVGWGLGVALGAGVGLGVGDGGARWVGVGGPVGLGATSGE